MGGTHKHPKKHLSFHSLLQILQEAVNEIKDTRVKERIIYSLNDVYTSGFAMFFLQDPSLLEFQRRFQEEVQQNNLSTVFKIGSIPSDTQLRDLIDIHDNLPLLKTFKTYFQLLQRGKHLEEFQYIDKHYLIAIDGSGYFSSENVKCSKCLIKQQKDGTKRYYHQILQATLVHPEKREVIPLAPEFIHNEDGQKKQDCERNASKRMLAKIKADHPFLPIIITGDSLFSNKPFIDLLNENNFSYILVAKPDDHKSLYADIEGLRQGNLLERCTRKEKNREYIYEWTNQVDINGSIDSPPVNFCQLTIVKNGKQTYRNAWVTDLHITEETVQMIVAGGRARWKIENEGFNTLKNHGYHLEHNFGHGKHNLSETFFILNLLAFFFHQIFQICDGAYQAARLQFSARKEYWNCIRSIFRLFIIQSWDILLERINSPPVPMP